MLCGEARADVVNLLLDGLLIQRYEKVRCPKVSVVLGNLVFEYHVIPESVPSKLAKKSMILVQVMPIVGEYEIWLEGHADLSKILFDILANVWKKCVLEFL